MRALRLLETCLYVDDLDAAERFYSRVLGLERIAKVPGRHVFFRCGDQVFLLFDPSATENPGSSQAGVPTHGARGPGHAAFRVERAEIPEWKRRLAEVEVAIEREVEWEGGGSSIYFRDPAGNCLELATPETWFPQKDSRATRS